MVRRSGAGYRPGYGRGRGRRCARPRRAARPRHDRVRGRRAGRPSYLAGVGQLRAGTGRGGAVSRATARGVPSSDGAGDQPGPADGAVRTGVSGATAVAGRRRRVGRGRVVQGTGGGGRPAAGSSTVRPDRRDLRAGGRDGAGDRTGRRPVSHPRTGRHHRRPVPPAPDAHRRLPCRRPASLGAGGAGLEPCPAGAGRPGAAAPGVGVRGAVHRCRGGGCHRVPGRRCRRRTGPARRTEPAGGDRLPERDRLSGVGDHPTVRDGAAHRGR